MGRLPDGRQVHRIEVKTGLLQSNHFVYYVDRADTTVNYEEKVGKSSELRLRAMLAEMQVEVAKARLEVEQAKEALAEVEARGRH